MADSQGAVHRSGPFKQQNKSHKHGRHKSKGSLETINKGRINMKSLHGKKLKETRKVDRKNQLKQLRNKKRQETMDKKRSIGTEEAPPHLIVVLSMNNAISYHKIFQLLTSSCCGHNDLTFTNYVTMIFPITKQRFTFLFPRFDDLHSITTFAKVADTLLMVYDVNELDLSPFSNLILDVCFAQGLPSTFHVVLGLDSLSAKKQKQVKKKLQTTIEKRFPQEKLHPLNSQQDAGNVLRCLSQQKRRPVFARDSRPYILADNISYEDNTSGTLKVRGYIRGRALSANQLVHIDGCDSDYQLAKIESFPDPCPLKFNKRSNDDAMNIDDNDTIMEGAEGEIEILEIADPNKQESLQSEVIPDAMDNEQTWPTAEELEEAESNLKMRALLGTKETVHKKVVRGVSDYQATWISDGTDDDIISDDESINNGADAVEYSDSSSIISTVQTEMDTDSVAFPDNSNYDDLVNMEDEHKQLEMFLAEKENRMFPDEMDTPLDVRARLRFAKYRGLKSFYKSPWDPKENLPLNYARIFQFSNFKSTRKKVLSDKDEEGVKVGAYVTVYINGISKVTAELLQSNHLPLIIYGLLPHENKMSVVNFAIKRTSNYSQPLKSKDELIFYCGVRNFSASAIFSQHTRSDKHKFERFAPNNCTTVATVYAPIQYPPAKVLVFKKLDDGTQILVATGSVLSVDPDRVIVKKVILSGHPFKIYKKSAVIRYMFFNREDILWFKPVELKTKHGLRGHIKEPLGTHGHMKCIFDKPLKAHDTILMSLYKRVYPKWSYSSLTDTSHKWTISDTTTNYDSDDMQSI